MSTISVNGQSVGATENMFRRYTFDIKAAAVAGANELVVSFESPLSYATRKFNEQAQDHIVPPVCVDPQFQGECHANHIRKMQASFRFSQVYSCMYLTPRVSRLAGFPFVFPLGARLRA